MMTTLVVGALVALGAAPAQAPKADVFSVDRFEKWAAELPFFFPEHFFAYGRGPEALYRNEIRKDRLEHARRVLAQATARTLPEKELIKLLKHSSARVRMLALAALFAREEPARLPLFVPLLDDTAAGIPKAEVQPRARAAFTPADAPVDPPPLKEQPVQAAAFAALQTYYQAVGLRADTPAAARALFDAYWAPRKDRRHCASWDLVRLTRAGRGTSATTKDMIQAIRAIRADVDRRPEKEGAWTVLWLGSDFEYHVPHFASPADVVAAGKTIGSRDLLRMLEGANPSGDPDLETTDKAPWARRKMPYFVLTHAKELLEPAMADRLLELSKTSVYQTPLWDVAAAALQPARGGAILAAALAKFPGPYQGRERADLAAAIWKARRLDETKLLLDWFYSESLTSGTTYPHPRAQFLGEVGRGPRDPGEKFLKQLVADRRFATCDWQSVAKISESAGAWRGQPVITRQEFDDNCSPWGMDFDAHLASARKLYPKETERADKALDDFRARLRAALR